MKRFIWLIMFTLIALFFPMVGFTTENQEWGELFFRANQAYKGSHFQEAIEGYEQLIQSGYENGHLYYNLGNAYFRLDYLGRAILNYERARLLIPRDADLNFNLGYGRDQTRDAITEPPDFMSMTFFWFSSLSQHELFWGFAVLNVLFWLVLLIKLFHRSEWTYYVSLLLLVFWIITGVSLGLQWYQVKTDDRAVILEKEVNVLAGPDTNDTVLFKLHEGTIVHHERSEDGWSLVRLADKKRGWVKANTIENINMV